MCRNWIYRDIGSLQFPVWGSCLLFKNVKGFIIELTELTMPKGMVFVPSLNV